MEIWETIDGFDGVFKISNLGRVKRIECIRQHPRYGQSKFKEKIFSVHINTGGYPDVTLQHNGIRKTFRVHRLVAAAFIPNPENKVTVNHKNGIKTDNSVENLEWNTNSENTKHSYRMGLQADRRGENSWSKLKEQDVKTIKALLYAGCNHRMLAEQFNISRPTITAISGKRLWSHVNI